MIFDSETIEAFKQLNKKLDVFLAKWDHDQKGSNVVYHNRDLNEVHQLRQGILKAINVGQAIDDSSLLNPFVQKIESQSKQFGKEFQPELAVFLALLPKYSVEAFMGFLKQYGKWLTEEQLANVIYRNRLELYSALGGNYDAYIAVIHSSLNIAGKSLDGLLQTEKARSTLTQSTLFQKYLKDHPIDSSKKRPGF